MKQPCVYMMSNQLNGTLYIGSRLIWYVGCTSIKVV